VAVLYKPFTPQDLLDEFERAIRAETIDPMMALVATDQRLHVRRLLTPLEPTMILRVRVGADELRIETRPTDGIVAHDEALILPARDGEPASAVVSAALALIVAGSAKDVSEEDALRHMLGCSIASELLTPGGEGDDLPFALGPAIVGKALLEDRGALTIHTFINGQKIDRWSVHDLPRPLGRIVAEVSNRMALEAGAVLLIEKASGDAPPSAASTVRPDDEILVEIAGLGRLANDVAPSDAEPAAR
jgi:5-oxopent-3-ene-1,2,5-tricarboxylate decarboxylase/2-hydroxyhepta-2,4-diene-1,7-dioate isomerase